MHFCVAGFSARLWLGAFLEAVPLLFEIVQALLRLNVVYSRELSRFSGVPCLQHRSPASVQLASLDTTLIPYFC